MRVLAALAASLVAAVAAAAGPAAAATRPVSLRWLEMVDELHGYALSGAGSDAYRLLRTADGGHVWTDVTPAVRPSGPVGVHGSSTVVFSTRVRAGVFAVERSDDAGRTWRRSLPFADPHGQGAGQPTLLDARHLYVAVDEGAAAGSQAQALYASDDGGHRWRFVSRTALPTTTPPRPGTLPFGCDKNGYGFATPARGWAGGYCAGGRPFFYRSDDGGRTWRSRDLPGLDACACSISAPRFFTSRLGVLDAIGFTTNGTPVVRVYWTSDGGAHWRESRPPGGRGSGAVSLADAATVWLVTSPPGSMRGPFERLLVTTDAGRRWRVTRLPFDAGDYQLDALGATVAYAVRTFVGPSRLLLTTDGGRHWAQIATVLAATHTAR